MQELTLDDGQEDDNDEEEKCDVEDNALNLKLISSGVHNLVTDAPTGTHSNVHVKHVALKGNTLIYCVVCITSENEDTSASKLFMPDVDFLTVCNKSKV